MRALVRTEIRIGSDAGTGETAGRSDHLDELHRHVRHVMLDRGNLAPLEDDVLAEIVVDVVAHLEVIEVQDLIVGVVLILANVLGVAVELASSPSAIP